MFRKKNKEKVDENVEANIVSGSETISEASQNTTSTENAVDTNKKKKKKNGKKGKKKFVILGIVILVIAVVAIKVSSGGNDMKPFVSTKSLERMDLEQIVSIKGNVQGSETANVTSSESKEVVSILVKEGDVVTKGQLLATLKSTGEDAETQL
ncbi:MAG: biotin/lipoyl-binding protein, partial [Anaerovorax sp.]|nr:biotin/lipoyl-binding protein [Anaerovorax sp.]